jgi:hypothetical protein
MQRRALFEPGDLVKTFTGECGLVISRATLEKMIGAIRQGRRPGCFFAQGSCENIDYLTQVPVFFEDGTYDIMKSMNIKKAAQAEEDKRAKLETMIEDFVSKDH